MTIDEAIKRLKTVTQADERDFPLELEDAMELGIEALKRERLVRKHLKPSTVELLPGETED